MPGLIPVRLGEWRLRTGRPVLLETGAAVGVAVLVTALWLATSPGGTTSSVAATPAGQAGPPSPAPSLAAVVERYVVIPEGSQAVYRVGKTLLRFNRPNVGAGVTRTISGEILFDRQHPANTRLRVFTVDISQLRSDESPSPPVGRSGRSAAPSATRDDAFPNFSSYSGRSRRIVRKARACN